MPKKPTSDTRQVEASLRQAEAVAFLQEHMHEPVGYWEQFLINNRRPDRKPAYRVPFHKRGGAIHYKRADLGAFLTFEKNRRLTGQQFTGRAAEVMQAFGIGSTSGGPFGRVLKCDVHAQVNESGPHAQLIINEPLLVFYLPLDQVDELIQKLNAVSRELKGARR